MNDTITMTEDKIHLLFTAFAFGGVLFGYILGRLIEMGQPKNKPKKQRRTKQDRHSRSHW